jgi:WD40 repeat protein
MLSETEGGAEKEQKAFPLEVLQKVSMHMDICTLKSVILASRKIYEAVDKDAFIWKKLCRIECSAIGCTSQTYKQQLKERYLTKRSWELRWNEGVTSLRYPTNTEITVLKVYDNLVFTASNSPHVRIWDMDMKLLETVDGHRGSTWTLDYRKGILVTGSTDRTAQIWDCSLRRAIHTLAGHTSTIRVVKIVEDLVITGSRDKSIRIWEMSSGKCKYLLRGHKDSVRTLDVSEQKGLLVSGSYDGSCIIWNYRKGEGVRHIEGHMRRVYIARIFSEWIFTGGQDRTINLSRIDGTLISKMYGHSGTIFDIKRGEGFYVYTLSVNGVIGKWDASRARQVAKICLGEPAVSFSLSNSLIVVGTTKSVSIYDAETMERVRSLLEDVESVYCVETCATHIFVGCKIKGHTHVKAFAYSTLGLEASVRDRRFVRKVS